MIGRRRGFLPFSLVLACTTALALLSPAPLVAAEGQPVVTAAVQVTPNPAPVRAHSSPQLAVNPTNNEVVVVESDVQGTRKDPKGTRGCNVHISSDGGRTWFPGGDPMTEPWTECSRVVINGPYATLAFGPSGVLYVAFTASDPKWANPHPPATIPRHVFLARSTDGGRTFRTTTVFKGPDEAAPEAGQLAQEGQNGRATVAVDPEDEARVYVSWTQGGSREKKATSMVAASTDGGRTFGEPVDISDDRGGSQPRIAVGRGGTVHAVIPAGTFGLPRVEPPGDPHPRPFLYRTSDDGGKTWSKPNEIDRGVGSNRKVILVADPNSDALYITWYGNFEKVDVAQGDYLDVFLLVSRDGGKTWGEPQVVNEGAKSPEGVKRYDPGLSVAPNGRVDIAWYDFRNSPVPEGLVNYEFNGGGFQDVYYTSSSNQGRTFQRPDVRVTDRIMDRRIGVWSNNYHSHTNVGIASTDDAAYFAWQDSRNGDAETNAEDVYFASAIHVGDAGDVRRAALAAAPGDDDGVPPWVVAVSAFAVGLGLATFVFLLLGRRRPFSARAARVQ